MVARSFTNQAIKTIATTATTAIDQNRLAFLCHGISEDGADVLAGGAGEALAVDVVAGGLSG